MGQQTKVTAKRRRRASYLKRKKELVKSGAAATRKEAGAKAEEKAAKKPAAKKAAAKKAPAKKAAKKMPAPSPQSWKSPPKPPFPRQRPPRRAKAPRKSRLNAPARGLIEKRAWPPGEPRLFDGIHEMTGATGSFVLADVPDFADLVALGDAAAEAVGLSQIDRLDQLPRALVGAQRGGHIGGPVG